MINKRKNSFRNCIIFTRTEQGKKRKEIFQIVNSCCFCVVYFVLMQFISLKKNFNICELYSGKNHSKIMGPG